MQLQKTIPAGPGSYLVHETGRKPTYLFRNLQAHFVVTIKTSLFVAVVNTPRKAEI